MDARDDMGLCRNGAALSSEVTINQGKPLTGNFRPWVGPALVVTGRAGAWGVVVRQGCLIQAPLISAQTGSALGVALSALS